MTKVRYIIISLLIILMIFSTTAFAAKLLNKEELLIVVNAKSKYSSIEEQTVKSVFLGRTNKIKDEYVEITILKDGIVHYSFLRTFIKLTPIKYIYHWKKLVYTGKAKMPKIFKTEAEMIKYISDKPNAIGYISVETSKDKTIMSDKVKTIAVKYDEYK